MAAAKQYRVIAPYVTLKMVDGPGPAAIHGFYQGQIVDSANVDEKALKRHLDRKMIEEFAPSKEEKSEGSSRAAKKSASAKKSADAAPSTGDSSPSQGGDNSSSDN